ncbi:glycerol-3-phosphate dehydrogenase (NAD(P)+) [Metamycoplasma subdolum]|uniref:Glycerol-3-phosphate dehydrogenase n=1 Tax=Metamycoplasma subdolum TaxID=92407 RepID=A0A3L9ZZ96_9BACT|nr:NAD(P)H-dependent glycerol-3-phosphate dehydrogenase [Metamycoplasma subdolum]RMA77454.1 glycerol-3-phosphate dehydrogenase (NAD(P)+) [Metamycoplasma subdolum]WPB50317.1 NAD(P)H-dependent glycerol-3-phosphate dehydrogenase [Metamycoplasma subdolum]
MNKKILVIGSGAMGTACANILVDNKQEVLIYGVCEKEINELREGKNLTYFDEKTKLNKFDTTLNLKEALKDVRYILLAVPSKFIPDVVSEIKKYVQNKVLLINVAKGFWPNETKTVHTKLDEISKKFELFEGVVSLMGPSFASEIVNRKITFIDAVSHSLKFAQEVQKLFSNEYLRVYTQDDIIGAEVGAIYKNMLAIASGLIVALGYNINTQAALLTRGFKEMKRYCKFVGGKIETLSGLTGLGDLILTALSDKSRNYKFGLNFFKDSENKNNITVEGINSIKTIYENYVVTNKLNLPIIDALYKAVFLKKEPENIIKILMKRPLIKE